MIYTVLIQTDSSTTTIRVLQCHLYQKIGVEFSPLAMIRLNSGNFKIFERNEWNLNLKGWRLSSFKSHFQWCQTRTNFLGTEFRESTFKLFRGPLGRLPMATCHPRSIFWHFTSFDTKVIIGYRREQNLCMKNWPKIENYSGLNCVCWCEIK